MIILFDRPNYGWLVEYSWQEEGRLEWIADRAGLIGLRNPNCCLGCAESRPSSELACECIIVRAHRPAARRCDVIGTTVDAGGATKRSWVVFWYK